jgi:hypothetical protein
VFAEVQSWLICSPCLSLGHPRNLEHKNTALHAAPTLMQPLLSYSYYSSGSRIDTTKGVSGSQKYVLHWNHICPKRCGEPCGDCMVVVDPMILQCGHTLEDPRCHPTKNRSHIECDECQKAPDGRRRENQVGIIAQTVHEGSPCPP